MTTYNINQFAQTALKGSLALGLNVNVLSAKIYASSVASFYGATAVKLVDVAGAIPTIEKAAAGDTIFGFIRYNIKSNTGYAVNSIAEVAFDNCVMIMEANAAIAAGAQVEIVASGDKVVTLGSNTAVGRALEKATASGDLIKVLITTH